MPEFCVVRGSRSPGRRPLRRFLCRLALACSLVAAVVCAAGGPEVALGASGGGSLGGGPKPGHRGQPRARAPANHAGGVGYAAGSGNPLSGRAMWIWELPATNHGDLSSIVATAKRYGIGTLLIKSSDGTGMWSQFNSQLVQALHASGLRVCAWQYVYGNHPTGEADVGAAAVKDGADCLIIDAESEYEGKYVAAQTYMTGLRAQVGANYPLALAGFPYIDYHPGFPYSVFLGPGGAQSNAPQMYWKDIGTTTDAVFAHTYSYNLIYGRPIFPLGQIYSRPPAHQIYRFRQLSRVYGASGVSWWDWQEATPSAWEAVSRPAGGLGSYQPYTTMAPIKQGAAGDLVVWAQEHLISAGYAVGVDGGFGESTRRNVLAFQAAHSLTADGIIGSETWQALLRYPPARILWGVASRSHPATAGRSRTAMAATAATAPAAAAPAAAAGTRYAPVPESASQPAKRDEIPGLTGAGRP